jgi:transcriptional regulator with PAS, ATPase and Fis domain
VRSMNVAAARLLRVAPEALSGNSLAEFPHLEPLEQLLATARREDGSVVRLPHGAVVVSARPLEVFEQGARGVVVTLVEIDRAERMAVRIAHSRPRYGFHDVIGASPPMVEALRLARQAASVDASVMVTGESGTGTEVFAQAIHTGGDRKSEPFVGINCAALPRDLLEAELFGHERGAFTGARNEGAMGKFEQAGEGTLLLDEIGDMPLDMQVKLLRVLQERVVVRLGGSRERPMLARVIATTHRNLDLAVEKGTFRLDLLYRLRVLHIHLPALRDRPEDVDAIALHLLQRVAESQRKRVRSLGAQVLAALRAYPWPGNIRELSNVMEREVSLLPQAAEVLERFQSPLGSGLAPSSWGAEPPTSPTSVRLRAVAPLGVFAPGNSSAPGAPGAAGAAGIVPLAEVERRAFVDAYLACNQSVSRASKALGVSKVTFYAKLRQWGMHPADDGAPDSVRSAMKSTPDE